MSISFSLPVFPANAATLDNVKLPWGCVIKPFAQLPTHQEIGAAADVPRCESCFAYLNPICTWRKNYWQCSICKEYNSAPERYHNVDQRKVLPELCNSIVELKLEEEAGVLAFIAVIDQNGDKDYFEAVKGSLLAAMEALPDETLVGLISFSGQIGLFDLTNSALPPSVTHITVPEDPTASPEISFDEILPLEQFLVKKGENIRSISAAIEALPLLMESSSLDPSSSSASSASILLPPTVGNESEKENETDGTSEKRAFGSAIRSLIDYLSSSSPKQQTYNSKIMCFVNGAANWGAGSIPAEDTRVTALHTRPSISFYEQQAKRAVSVGISIDLIVTSSAPVGLTNVHFLATLTGGRVASYDTARAHDALPHDTFKRLSQPMAFRGLIRLRTTSEFSQKKDNYYGSMLPDLEHDNLYHVASADERSVIGFEFEWRVNEHFEELAMATLQLAFAYTLFPSRNSSSQKSPLRILRIVTVTQQITNSPTELVRCADLHNVTFLLTQKVIGFCDQLGAESAQNALNDWLANVVRLYDKHNNQTQNAALVPLDAKIPGNLQLLPRIVFGLQKSVLFAKEIHPDAWMQTICTWSNLEPKLLKRSVYADLTAFSAKKNFEPVLQNLPLSAHAIASSGECVFLLDTCQTLCIFYTAIAIASNITFPPPKDSPIRRMFHARKAESPFVPNSVITKEGNPDQGLFSVALIDDGNASSVLSYSQFCETIQSKITKAQKL